MAVFSRRDSEWIEPTEGSGRRYLIAPLTYRERVAYSSDLTREGGVFPSQAQMLEAMRNAVRELGAANVVELVAAIDAAEAEPDNLAAQSALATIEAACVEVPAYAALLAARERFMGMMPFVAARHALRGWEGAGMPAFRRERGVVPESLMDEIPDAEVQIVGFAAAKLMRPGPDAAKNSEGLSPSPESPMLTPEA